MAIDDASRVAYAQVLPDEDANCCVAFLRAAVAYYAGLGVHIKGVYTDNAKAYADATSPAPAACWTDHQYTKPYTPRTNGKAERFFRAVYASGLTHSRTGPGRSAAMPCLSGYAV